MPMTFDNEVCIGRHLTREWNQTSNPSWEVSDVFDTPAFNKNLTSFEQYFSRGNEIILHSPREMPMIFDNWVCIGRHLTREWNHTSQPSWDADDIWQLGVYRERLLTREWNQTSDPSWDADDIWQRGVYRETSHEGMKSNFTALVRCRWHLTIGCV